MEEYQRLLEAADEGPWYLRPLIELSANTGLRRGNLLSLRWEEVDLEARVIRKTRTKNSRTLALPLNERGVEILKTLQEGREGDSAFVFPHREGQQAGRPLLDTKNSFRSALRRAGIRNFRWHDLRHCFGSWLVMGGANLVAVQKLMGHRSVRMTLRYAHLSPQYLKGEVEILDKTLPKACCPPEKRHIPLAVTTWEDCVLYLVGDILRHENIPILLSTRARMPAIRKAAHRLCPSFWVSLLPQPSFTGM